MDRRGRIKPTLLIWLIVILSVAGRGFVIGVRGFANVLKGIRVRLVDVVLVPMNVVGKGRA